MTQILSWLKSTRYMVFRLSFSSRMGKRYQVAEEKVQWQKTSSSNTWSLYWRQLLLNISANSLSPEDVTGIGLHKASGMLKHLVLHEHCFSYFVINYTIFAWLHTIVVGKLSVYDDGLWWVCTKVNLKSLIVSSKFILWYLCAYNICCFPIVWPMQRSKLQFSYGIAMLHCWSNTSHFPSPVRCLHKLVQPDIHDLSTCFFL